MAVDVDHILARYKSMAAKRELWLRDWQDIATLTTIDTQQIQHRNSPGNLEHDRFDSTGMEASGTFASNLQWGMTNPAVDWARIKFRKQAVNEAPGVADWLEVVSEEMLQAYLSSNFYLSSESFYLNYGDFGTAALYCEERQDFQDGVFYPGLSFRSLYPGRYVIEENAQRRVDTLFREMLLTPRQALQQFADDHLPDRVRTMAKEPTSTDKPEVYLHCVYPRADVTPGRLGKLHMPYASCYIHFETKQCVREGGYEEFPYFVARFRTQDEESPYGYGPGHIALPDMRSLDRLKEMALESVALHLQPPLNVIESGVVGHISQISLQSLALNRVSRPDAITPLTPTGNFQIVELEQADLRQSVKRAYYADQFELLLRPPETQMTATEYLQRVRLLERLLGPAVFRLRWEFLDPLADRTFGILARSGVLPPPPLPVVMAAMDNNGQLDVEYEGPLARSQRSGDVEAIQRVYAVGLQIVEATQDVSIWDNIDHDRAMAQVAEVEGLPRHLIRSPAAREALRQQRQAQQATALEQAQVNENLTALGRVAPLVREIRPQGQEVT